MTIDTYDRGSPAMELDRFQGFAHRIAEQRREARRDFERYAEQEADAERDYRKRLAKVFATAKSEGLSDRAADIRARGEAADWAHRRDIAHSLAKSALLRVEELERAAASLRHVSERSSRELGA